MGSDSRDGVRGDEVYRTRCTNALLHQAKEDYRGLRRLWKRLERGPAEPAQIEELVGVLSRLRQDLEALEALRNEGLEGVLSGEIEGIRKDFLEKESELRTILFSVSSESE